MSHLKRIAKKFQTSPDFSKPEYDVHSGIFTELHYDSGTDVMAVNRVQDVEPILKSNQKAFDSVSTKGKRFAGDMRQVASIPMVVLEDWMKKGLIKNPFRMDADDRKAMKRLLNDKDNQFLRTCPGQI